MKTNLFFVWNSFIFVNWGQSINFACFQNGRRHCPLPWQRWTACGKFCPESILVLIFSLCSNFIEKYWKLRKSNLPTATPLNKNPISFFEKMQMSKKKQSNYMMFICLQCLDTRYVGKAKMWFFLALRKLAQDYHIPVQCGGRWPPCTVIYPGSSHSHWWWTLGWGRSCPRLGWWFWSESDMDNIWLFRGVRAYCLVRLGGTIHIGNLFVTDCFKKNVIHNQYNMYFF